MPAENKIQTQSEAEEKMVDLPDTGSAVDVEIAETKKTVNPDDDTPAVETEVETASSEEMDDYGQKVQTRIDKLTKRLREAERREQAAVQYAQGVQKEAQQQAARSNQIDTGYVTEFADRVEAQMTQAKNELKQAMDLGDVDKQGLAFSNWQAGRDATLASERSLREQNRDRLGQLASDFAVSQEQIRNLQSGAQALTSDFAGLSGSQLATAKDLFNLSRQAGSGVTGTRTNQGLTYTRRVGSGRTRTDLQTGSLNVG